MRQIALGNFDIVAEDLVVIDFERFDPGAFLFLRLQFGDPLFAVGGGGAEFIQFGVVAGADHAAIGSGCRWFIGNGFCDPLRQFRHGADVVADGVNEGHIAQIQNGTDTGQDLQTVSQRLHVPGIEGAYIQLGGEAFDVPDRPQTFPDLGEGERIVLEVADDVLTGNDRLPAAEGFQDPAAHETASHGG